MIWLSCRSVLMKHEAVWSPAMTLTVRQSTPCPSSQARYSAKSSPTVPTRSGRSPRSPRLKQILAPVPPRRRVSESTRNETLEDVHLVGQDVVPKPARERP